MPECATYTQEECTNDEEAYNSRFTGGPLVASEQNTVARALASTNFCTTWPRLSAHGDAQGQVAKEDAEQNASNECRGKG